MLRNPFKALQDLVARPALQIGTVTSVNGGVAVVELPGGGSIQARGDADVADRVFVRDGVIESKAPSLPILTIDV
ncbi:MAG: hypothetical protein Q8K24_05985 [Hydrogenophaga sp.]|nr:hypothetical protein [Hydrogenophaga sp.]